MNPGLRDEGSEAIAFAGENYPWLEGFRFVKIHGSVRDDDHHISNSALAGSWSVQATYAGTAFTPDNIGFYPRAVVDVDHLYFLVFNDLRCIHKVLVEGQAAYIMEVGFGNGGPVNF